MTITPRDVSPDLLFFPPPPVIKENTSTNPSEHLDRKIMCILTSATNPEESVLYQMSPEPKARGSAKRVLEGWKITQLRPSSTLLSHPKEFPASPINYRSSSTIPPSSAFFPYDDEPDQESSSPQVLGSPTTAISVVDISGEEGKRRILHEISILKYCENAGISGVIRLQGYSPDSSEMTQQILATPWCKFTLEKEFSKKSPSEQKSIFYQICRTVHEIHTQLSIAHFDIKPANILIDKYGNVFLNDFGCALIVDSTTKKATEESWEITEGTTTTSFDPPNDGEDILPMARDVFSLGLTMLLLIIKLTNTKPKITLQKLLHKTDAFAYADTEDSEIEAILNKYVSPSSDLHLNHLLKGMLRVKQSERMTMDDVMHHEYFAQLAQMSE